MNGTPFKLGTFAKSRRQAFRRHRAGRRRCRPHSGVRRLSRLRAHWRLSSTDSIDGLLENWDANFAALQEIVADIEKQGTPGAAKLASLRALPPVRRPGKMFYAAQNFQEHVDEMLRAGMTPAGGPQIHRREIDDASPTCFSRRRARSAAPMTTSPSRSA